MAEIKEEQEEMREVRKETRRSETTARRTSSVHGARYGRFLCLIFACLLLLSGCGAQPSDAEQQRTAYGVFIGLDAEEKEKLYNYQTIVIDAQYYSAEELSQLHEHGVIVYSYLNIGSLEEFRPYYEDYKDLALGTYENWEDESWVDVSDTDWQSLVRSLADELTEKGVDGFFIDNCDVYYVYEEQEIFDGLTEILRELTARGKPVIINGGDTFVTAYRLQYGTALDIMTGVNQESVFSCIDFDTDTFGTNTDEERTYFQSYVEACAADGCDVYLLEYTTDEALMEEALQYCTEHGFMCYFSSTLDLNEPRI